MKGFIVTPLQRFFLEFCHDANLNPKEYRKISNLEDIRGWAWAWRRPVYLVGISFTDGNRGWYDMLASLYYKEFLQRASVVLRPAGYSKWY